MSASILVDGPGLWAYNFELDKSREHIIGRTRSADITLPDEKVSSRHARIFYQDGSWHVEDLGSSNGTLLNGVQMSSSALQSADVLRFGSTEIVFRDRESVREDVWDKTVLRMSRHSTALKAAVERKSKDEAVVIPDLHLSPTEQQHEEAREGGEIPSSEIYEEREFSPDRFVAPRREASGPGSLNPEDMIWVAEKMASILGELAKQQEREKSRVYRVALNHLREELGVENGFVMIPNRETRRWVIEAWVGNNREWTRYEKEHPVPLTVANDAYRQDAVISNGYGELGESISNSASLMQLKVQSYIAIPLHRDGTKAGLLYFDIRNAVVKFSERQVQLTRRIGDYLLELDLRVG